MAEKETEKKDYTPPAGASSTHKVTIGGKSLSIQAHADWIPLRDGGKPVAEMFFVHYSVKPAKKTRPLTFLFNGGPGAASAYLHLGAVGPFRVEFGTQGGVVAPPVQISENAESWLAFSDLVFIDPVDTGFSRSVKESRVEAAPFKEEEKKETGSASPEAKEFFKLQRDLDLLGEFIERFLSRFHRWESPIFIAGESYGGFRVGKLSRQLLERGIGLNGAIMISPALDFSTRDRSDYDVLPWVEEFPSLCVTAWYHGKARGFPKKAKMEEVLEIAEEFARGELAAHLVLGQEQVSKKFYAKMAGFLGLSEEYVSKKYGRVPFWLFVRELLREQRLVCGFYDASCTVVDPYPDRDWNMAPDATLAGIESTFTSGINAILRDRLKLSTDRRYNLLSMSVFTNWSNDQKQHFFNVHTEAIEDLRCAMSINPELQVMITHGYFDLVTPYYSSKRLASLMKLTDEQRANLTLANYYGGHMYYTWDRSRKESTRETERFYRKALAD